MELYKNASKNKNVDANEFVELYCYFKTLTTNDGTEILTGRTSRTEQKDIISYFFNVDPSSVEASNIEMLLRLVQDGTVDKHVFEFIPSNGKLSQEIVDDVVKLYEASELGIEPIEIFVPTFKNVDETVLGGNETISFNNTYKDIKIGDVFQVEGEEFIRIKTSDTESIQLNISKETYFKLFPPVERYGSTQNNIGNCWEVSGINTLLNSPDTRAKMLKLFSQEGDDIVIRLPESSFTITSTYGEEISNIQEQFKEIRFKNGELPAGINLEYYSQGALGFQMLEYTEGRILQADLLTKIYNEYYELITCAKTEANKAYWIEDLAKFSQFLEEHGDKTEIYKDVDEAHYYEKYAGKYDSFISELRNGGYQSNTYALFGFKDAKYIAWDSDVTKKQEIEDILSDSSFFDEHIVGFAAGGLIAQVEDYIATGLCPDHAYRIKPGIIEPDGKIKTYKLINPWGIFESELTLQEIMICLKGIDIAKK